MCMPSIEGVRFTGTEAIGSCVHPVASAGSCESTKCS